MSLFPIRIKPGGTLTVHLRLQVRFPTWIQRRDYLVDPQGNRTLCYDRMVAFMPFTIRSEEDEQLIEATGQLVGGAPILMAARYLQNEFEDTNSFLEQLRGLRDATHHYYTLKLPEDAPLGRYHFELEDYFNGQIRKSQTADTDYFFVESLQLDDVITNGKTSTASVYNPSPEPVMAQLYEFPLNPSRDAEFETKHVKLAPNSKTSFEYQGSAFLIYRDGDAMLRFTKQKDPLCVRNPALNYVLRPGFTYVFKTQENPEKGYQLDGLADTIWYQANGFLPRSQIRTNENASLYDDMLKIGLIQEVDSF